MRIVLDTNAVFSALLWRGTPYRLLQSARLRPDVQLCSSTTLIEELTSVLARPAAAKRLALIGRSARDVLLDYVAATAVVAAAPLEQPVCRDPDDDAVLAAALAAAADLIVTGDDDLLVLERFQNIPIVKAAVALQMIDAGR